MSFARYTTPTQQERQDARSARMAAMAGEVARSSRSRAVCGPAVNGGANPKESAPVRSEPYRRLVAALPCAACRVEGYSQAAHPPPTGKGRKESDMDCFPLCCTRPGIVGCHVEFDQMRLIPRPSMRVQAQIWAAAARTAIKQNDKKLLEQTT